MASPKQTDARAGIHGDEATAAVVVLEHAISQSRLVHEMAQEQEAEDRADWARSQPVSDDEYGRREDREIRWREVRW